jgi:hypothetical protein
MKNIGTKIIIAAIVLMAIGYLFTACKKDSYYQDSGVEQAKYDGNILQYLATKPDYFDSLVTVISLAGMNSVFEDSTITFFAPPQQCIQTAVGQLNRYLYNRGQDTVVQLQQIASSVWQDMLSLYILRGKYLLKDIPQMDTTQLQTFPGQGYLSWGGRPMNVGVIYNDVNNVKYAGYRQLCYSYIYNFTNIGSGSMINTMVATSDIQPSNGVVHVLQFQYHIFGFSSSNFISDAIAKGIGPVK